MDDIATIIICYKMSVKTMGKFTKDEFVKGCVEVGADDEKSWKTQLPNIRSSLGTYKDDTFKKVWLYAFDLNLEAGFKVIEIDVAFSLMDLFYAKTCKFLGKWKEYLESSGKETMKRDLWDMFCTLNKDTSGDWQNYVDDGCWPEAIDDFCEFLG